MVWTAPRTWVAAERPPATTLNTHIRDNFKAIGDEWTAYTPTWTSSGTAPALGNGTLTGWYMKTDHLVHYRLKLTCGSTTTYGTGTYTWSLPATAVLAADYPLGTAFIRDNSAGVFMRSCYTATGTGVRGISADGFLVDINSPMTWASGDTITINGTYEAA